jgi:archaetidylinositol phosphate synthase
MSSPSVVFESAPRVHRALTAALERRALTWMAHRAPRWLTSDQLTALGFVAQIAAGLSFAAARFHRGFLVAVIICIVLNWLGDSLDGTLARVRNQQRPRYGFYVDHVVDIFGSAALMAGLGFSGFVHGAVALAMLIAFLLLAGESFLATYTLRSFQMSQGIFGPTEIRLLLIAGVIALMRSSYATLLGHQFLLFDIGGVIATVGMVTMALVTAARHTAELYREEPLPQKQQRG